MFNKISDKINSTYIYSPAQLAYAGDAVFELLVRSYVLNNYDISVNQMHRLTVKFVKAKAQAYIVSQLTNVLSEEEKKIVKRGRNAKVTSSPKNVEFMDYRYATGFEALFGYLFLNKDIDRLMYIFDKVIDIIVEKDGKIENNRRKESGN
ncbi:MAG: Mini-ribonuclease 3 [Tissierellia bacterium]|nr:Mini-ribonuclease 3 [Tissierellia bacterium]